MSDAPPAPPSPPPPAAAFHPRALLLVGAFGGALRRASYAGVAAGIAGGAIAGFGLARSLPWPALVVVVMAASAFIGTAVAIVAVPTRTRRAFEAFSWLGHREVARFREATGTRPATNALDAAALLAGPPGFPRAPFRAEVMISLGRFAEARAVLASMEPAATELATLDLAGLHAFADVVETGALDVPGFEARLAAVPPSSALALEALAVRAVTLARLGLAQGTPDPLRPLREVRPRLGPDATRIVLRDTWLPFARSMALFGLSVSVLLLVTGVAR